MGVTDLTYTFTPSPNGIKTTDLDARTRYFSVPPGSYHVVAGNPQLQGGYDIAAPSCRNVVVDPSFDTTTPAPRAICSGVFTWSSTGSALPSVSLVNYIASRYRTKLVGYNAPGCDHFWGNSVSLTGGIVTAIASSDCMLCDGSVEITLKSCGGGEAPNDDYVVLINGTTIASGRIWSSLATPAKTLTIPLPAAKLRAALCHANGRPPSIDVFVEDDTIVSSMKASIKY